MTLTITMPDLIDMIRNGLAGGGFSLADIERAIATITNDTAAFLKAIRAGFEVVA